MTEPPASTAAGIAAVLEAIVETVRETGPEGAPGGILYAGLMAMGCSYSTFEALMGALVREGKLIKRGQIYHCAQPRESNHDQSTITPQS